MKDIHVYCISSMEAASFKGKKIHRSMMIPFSTSSRMHLKKLMEHQQDLKHWLKHCNSIHWGGDKKGTKMWQLFVFVEVQLTWNGSYAGPDHGTLGGCNADQRTSHPPMVTRHTKYKRCFSKTNTKSESDSDANTDNLMQETQHRPNKFLRLKHSHIDAPLLL